MPFPKKQTQGKKKGGANQAGGSSSSSSTSTEGAYPKSVLPDPKSPNNCKLIICVKPNSKENTIEAIDDECISVHVAEEAKDGKANTELLEYLADVLKIKKRDIDLDKGSRSHNKLFLISGVTPIQAYQRLRSEIKK